ncbi:MAG: hypothetical protein QXO74_05180 [Candidatus Methanomethylicia archaeon]
MKTIHRIWELTLIMVVVWIIMILMIVFIDKIIVPITISISSPYATLIDSIFKLMVSGLMAAIWLWIWVVLVQKYIGKNKN